ncbi:MAG: sigma-70 family RNA polymerase sigma factor, partial [Planctomycetes bacterium]|nr:sigma-70 family RNA polymerase sigma factor [Planctomycetota bacterium]
MHPDPGALLEAYRRRPDRSRLHRLLEGIEGRVFSVCFEVLRHRQDAEDATQDALLDICRGLDSVREIARFGAWVYRVAFHTALDGRRKRVTRDRHEHGIRSSAEKRQAEFEADGSDPAVVVHQALADLDDETRELLAEHYFAGVSLARIARREGVSNNAIWKRMESGRERLRRAIEARGSAVGLPALVGYLEGIDVPTPPTLVDVALLDAAARVTTRGIPATGGTLVVFTSLGFLGVAIITIVGIGYLGVVYLDSTEHVKRDSGTRRVDLVASRADRARSSTGPHSVPEPGPNAPKLDPTAAGEASPSVNEFARLVGRVLGEGAHPVPGVEVELTHGDQVTALTRTDADGRFEFEFARRTVTRSI